MKKQFGYSITEALITMFMVSLVFIIAAPSLGKKKQSFKFFNNSKHGAFVCDKKNCTFNPPAGNKGIYVIAIGGGGGGGSSKCSEEARGNSGHRGACFGSVDPYYLKEKNVEYEKLPACKHNSGGMYGYNYHVSEGRYFEMPEMKTHRALADESYVEGIEPVREGAKYQIETITGGGNTHAGYCKEYPGGYDPESNGNRCTTAQDSLSKEPQDSNHMWSQEDYLVGEANACSIKWIVVPTLGLEGYSRRYCAEGRLGSDGGNGYHEKSTFCPPRKDENCPEYDERGRCAQKDSWGNLRYRIGTTAQYEAESGGSITLELPAKPDPSYLDASLIDSKYNRKRVPQAFDGRLVYSFGGGCGGVITSGYYSGPCSGAGNGGASHPDWSSRYNEKGYSNGSYYSNWYDTTGFLGPNTDSTDDGSHATIQIKKNRIDWGDGGYSGEIKTGYFKNITGPVLINTGTGGKGGKNGLKGEDGTITRIIAKKGGFKSYTASEIPVVSGFFTDNGAPDGLLLEAEGGKGGNIYPYYESCIDSNTFGKLEGKKVPNSSVVEFSGGAGGDGGDGGTLPDCIKDPPRDGKDGQNGIVIIFY